MGRVGVAAESESAGLRSRTAGLAHALGLPVTGSDAEAFDALLVVTTQRIELRPVGPKQAGPVYVDFLAGAMRRRLRELASTRQLIARAVGFKGSPLHIVDATAGLGRDAFVLACLGCRVTAVERSPAIAALLADGLERAAGDSVVGPLVERIRLVRGDARDYLADLGEGDQPDVTYIDPMFPHQVKTALVKKEMRLCRLVAGDDLDAGELLRVALTFTRGRVVVKRPPRAPNLLKPPAFCYKGKIVRYDVYPRVAASK